MKIDLHTHSHFSDGAHSPQFVVERAYANGVRQLALTDHDCVDGYLAAQQLAMPDGPELIAGVEISTLWDKLEIHVLGLCIDPHHEGLGKLLADQQRRRRERLKAMNEKLLKAGISGLEQFMVELPCRAPGRAHVASFLAENTAAGTKKKAIRMLTRNGRFFVRPEWCPIAEAVNRIRQAGGIAVIAHPHRYPLSNSGKRRLLQDFCIAGGEAIEVCCSNMTATQIAQLIQFSQDFKLWVSAGSDFHSSEATWMDIGKIAPMPEVAKKNAIWTHPRWHFRNCSQG
jgi:predicted metal-dependent phosphoesterase TrpH